MKIYTGIGSRKAPDNILLEFENIGYQLAKQGYLLRSGGADGCDSAFEEGCLKANGNRNIFLPWENFNNNPSKRFYISKEAYEIGKKYFEMTGRTWGSLNIAVKKLMARNCYQVLGPKLNDPTSFIICWTPEGKEIGGTSQALRIAKDYNIKVYNFGREEDKKDFYEDFQMNKI